VVTYWWALRVFRRKTDIEEEQAIMIWSSSRPNYCSPEQINPVLINSNIYRFCIIETKLIQINSNKRSADFGCKFSN